MTSEHTDQTGNVMDFFENEVATTSRKARMTWIVGLLLVALLAVYLGGVSLLIRGMLEPRTAARMIAMQAEETIPQLLLETEVGLQAQAPFLADSLSKQLMKAMPALREEAERQIDATYEEVLPHLRAELGVTLHQYVEAHDEEIRDFYDAQKVEGFEHAFLDAVVDDTLAALDKEIMMKSEGRGIDHAITAALAGLTDIDGQLNTLLVKGEDEMTRSERLQRRLIVSWLRVVEDLMRQQQRAVSAS
ncbi:MAG: hypothetical protein HQ559_18340 [Lentisphaerae bacterium]|nr:hypothetical protein [Lentisphaerota bacterium]